MLLYVRRTEFGYGCVSSSAGCGGLQLNDIGDIAAGIFAPLAFLWLFVATLLQRRELGLQREELADTRAVLNDQRIELERSAEESNRQTKIMHSNLETSKSRETYDYFSLKLYYISRSTKEGIAINIVARKQIGAGYGNSMYWQTDSLALCPRDPDLKLSPTDTSTVDIFMGILYNNSQRAIRKIASRNEKYWLGGDNENQPALDFMHTTHLLLSEIAADADASENALVKLRSANLKLHKLSNEMASLHALTIKYLGKSVGAEEPSGDS